MQGIALMEPILAKAARKLGIDQVAIRRINCPEGKAPVRTGECRANAPTPPALPQGSARPRRGAVQMEGAGRAQRRSASARRCAASACRSAAYVGGTIGFDGLLVIKPDGRMRFQSGIGNLGTESVIDVHRAGAEVLGVPWEKCDVVWGDTSKNLPFTCVSGGSQTTHAMTRAAHATAMDAKQKLQEIAAKNLGGKPEDYEVANERVFRKGGGAGMTLAQAAQARHRAGRHLRRPRSARRRQQIDESLGGGAGGPGPGGGRQGQLPARRHDLLLCCQLCRGRSRCRNRQVPHRGFPRLRRCRHGDPSARARRAGAGPLDSRHWPCDRSEVGVSTRTTATCVAKRFYQSKPPTILDVPVDMQWAALDIPDPETPVGARGVGEPPVGGGCASILNALSDALGDEIFQRAPVNADTILTSLEAGRPMQHPLTAHI